MQTMAPAMSPASSTGPRHPAGPAKYASRLVAQRLRLGAILAIVDGKWPGNAQYANVVPLRFEWIVGNPSVI
jgi:hypothetical protein